VPSPCFQFYPEEFVGSGTVGTADAKEIAVYVLLLCLDWTEGGFVFEPKRLARWCKVSQKVFTVAWKHLSHKFTERDGRFYNNRLDKERTKQEEWRAKSKKGAEITNEKRWGGGEDDGRGGGQGGDQMATATEVANESPKGRMPLPLPLPSPELPTTTTPLSAEQPPKALGGGWPAAVAETWVRRIGVIREGRVGKDLHPFVRLYPSPDDAIRPLQRAVEIYADLCTRRSQKPAWLDFVRGVQGFVPATMLPPERAA
jgi:uncharacterized protein YdaU (DUF1376 family)